MSIAFIFPGQGSQIVGMGKEFFDQFSAAKHVFEEVDETLKQKLSNIMFNGPLDELTLTANAQPAILAVSIAILRSLQQEMGKDISELCSYVAGHSLGEYTALCAAKAISLSDAVRLVKLRGESMQSAVAPGTGSMAAILAMDVDQIERIIKDNGSSICEIANDNCPGQAVISGNIDAVDQVCEKIIQAGGKAIKLQVSAPFHCSLMDPVKKIMMEALSQVTINSPVVPVFANVLAAEVHHDQIINSLVKQISAMVRWRETVINLRDIGVTKMTEIGAGKVLTGIIKRIDSSLTLNNISCAKDIANFI